MLLLPLPVVAGVVLDAMRRLAVVRGRGFVAVAGRVVVLAAVLMVVPPAAVMVLVLVGVALVLVVHHVAKDAAVVGVLGAGMLPVLPVLHPIETARRVKMVMVAAVVVLLLLLVVVPVGVGVGLVGGRLAAAAVLRVLRVQPGLVLALAGQ